MKYHSTNNSSHPVDFREATIQGQAPDKGLYFPEKIPTVDAELLRDIETLEKAEIAFRVISPYVGNSIPEQELRRIVNETIDFPIPLVPVNDRIYSLELFHGPTLAFKDVGARFMSRCLGYFMRELDKKVTVLVATSGDTGGAVASGFLGVEGVEVVILYPKGKVSAVQEKQLTTSGSNIKAIAVSGSFDDCQRMVKRAFADSQVTKKMFLTSANSINVARWLPQQFYYFFAWQQWADKSQAPVISVPSGNFGNICAGLLAASSGLPVDHFIAACNSNDIVSHFLATGSWEPRPAVATLSNAMDVGDPSNFVRILEIFGRDHNKLRSQLSSATVTDSTTMETIRTQFLKTNYLLDPHGATAFYALEQYLNQNQGKKGIFLETAHPVKFPDTVEEATGHPVTYPEAVKELMEMEGEAVEIGNEYDAFISCLGF